MKEVISKTWKTQMFCRAKLLLITSKKNKEQRITK